MEPTKMMTPWGEKLDSANVLKEYPRPQMVRDSYENLNGTWGFEIDNSRSGAARGLRACRRH